MTGETHLSGLFRCVLGAFLVLTKVSVAAAQAEFHYQYGKPTNPFSSVREYTSILTVQHATSWRLGAVGHGVPAGPDPQKSLLFLWFRFLRFPFLVCPQE